MIEIEHLRKTWADADTPVLDDISLSIYDGEMYALVGKSGAGKSTLLRCINGLADYDAGSLKVDGVEVKDMGERELREFRRSIGMIFQQFSLLERETVFENVALPMKCWKYSKAEIEEKVSSLLELVGLADKKDSKPRNISGGQKQRVAIARALTMDPKILLCDEATSALDPDTANSILDLLMEINEKTGISVVVVTHQMEVVRRVCSRACVLENGKIVCKGTVQDLFIEDPRPLHRILGERHSALPAQGKNIQVSFYADEAGEASIFGRMAAELGVPLSIVRGGIQNYRDRDFGIFVVNVPDDAASKVVGYLDKHEVAWREMSEEESAAFGGGEVEADAPADEAAATEAAATSEQEASAPAADAPAAAAPADETAA